MNRYFDDTFYADFTLEELHSSLNSAFAVLSDNLVFHALHKDVVESDSSYDDKLAGSALNVIDILEAVLNMVGDDIEEKARKRVAESKKSTDLDKMFLNLVKKSLGIEED